MEESAFASVVETSGVVSPVGGIGITHHPEKFSLHLLLFVVTGQKNVVHELCVPFQAGIIQ